MAQQVKQSRHTNMVFFMAPSDKPDAPSKPWKQIAKKQQQDERMAAWREKERLKREASESTGA